MIFTAGDPNSARDNALVGLDFRYLNTRLPGGRVMQADAWFQRTETEGLSGDDSAFGVFVDDACAVQVYDREKNPKAPPVVVEVHLSHPPRREPWRSTSVVAPVATAGISGLGGLGVRLAVEAAAHLAGAAAGP